MKNNLETHEKSLTILSHQQLHDLTVNAAQSEKYATLNLLTHLAEVDRRKLFAIRGYSSLWLYVHQELHYSESQTSERINAMRLMVRVPEVKKEIEQNRLSLTIAAKLATHVRQERCDTTQTIQLLEDIRGKTTRDAERVLASQKSEPTRIESIKPNSGETTRITIDVDHEFLTLLQKIRELRGHVGTPAKDLLQLAMKETVQSITLKQRNKSTPTATPTATTIAAAISVPGSRLRAPEVKIRPNTSNSRYIPTSLKNAVRIRSGNQCEYTDTTTGRRCDCKMKLEFDHRLPFAMGGTHSLENLRQLCPVHNQLMAIQFYGRKHMDHFLKIG